MTYIRIMKKVWIRGLCFTLLLFLTAGLLDTFLTHFFQHETATKSGRIYKLAKRTDDFIVLGNSRVLINADVDSIQKITGLRGYNLGLDGSNPMHQYLMLENYFRFNKTKKVLLNIDPWGGQLKLNRLQRIYPFISRLDDDTIYLHLTSQFGRKVILWKYLPMFRYSLFNARLGLLAAMGIRLNQYREPIGPCGDYMNINTQTIRKPVTHRAVQLKIRPEVIQYWVRIAQLCRQNHATLHIYINPAYHTFYQSHQNIDSVIRVIQREIPVPFCNFCDSSICKNPDLFYDQHHLNLQGRRLFTPMLANYIQSHP